MVRIYYFHAPWCQACKTVGPAAERITDGHDGKLQFVKVDIEQHPDLANKYCVKTLPTLLAIDNGDVIGSLTGAKPESGIRHFVNHIASMA